jgi:hypothetical protein
MTPSGIEPATFRLVAQCHVGTEEGSLQYMKLLSKGLELKVTKWPKRKQRLNHSKNVIYLNVVHIFRALEDY